MRAPTLALLLTALLLGACASRPSANPANPKDPAGSNTPKLESDFADALTAPLGDLNLVRKPIPPVLQAAQQAPYATPADSSCAGLRAAVQELNAVLGADLDTPATPDNPSLLERGSDLATTAVLDAVRDTTTGFLPFRGWIRRLTGANKHAKAVIAAISAGAVRRAYLKGLGQAKNCPSPASPAPLPPPPPTLPAATPSAVPRP